MPRKKVSPDTEVIDGIAEIDDDEQLVEETTRKVRRERVSKPRATPEPEPEPAETFIDSDEDDEPPPRFSSTSLAARLYGDDENEPFRTEFCTVNIRRKPDAMNDHFANRCTATLNLPPLRNIDIATDEGEIEDQVRREFGGGHYFFQIHYKGQLGPSWQASLSDLPEHLRNKPAGEVSAQATAATPTPAEPAKDPLDSMLDSLTKMKLLKEALFGDEETRMQRRIEELERQIEERPELPPTAPLPENLAILEKALSTTNVALQEKLLDYAFPPSEGSHWIPETMKTIFEHKDEIGAILGSLLGGFAPKPPPQGIEAMLRGPAPVAPPPAIQPSQFVRKQIVTAGDAENADAGSTELETPETEERTDEGNNAD